MDNKARAYAIERRYRMLTAPWREIVTEIRSERGALLGASRFDDLSGVEKETALDKQYGLPTKEIPQASISAVRQ